MLIPHSGYVWLLSFYDKVKLTLCGMTDDNCVWLTYSHNFSLVARIATLIT